MPDESSTEVQNESGGALREKLEEALAANRELAQANRELNAQVVITQGGFSYVKPADLADVPVDEYAARAAQIQAERAAEREQIFREMAAAKGIKLDDEAPTPNTDPDPEPAISRVASLGTLGGTPPRQERPEPKTGEDWLDVALSNPKQK